VSLQARGGQSHPRLVIQEIYFFLGGLSSEGIVSTWEPSKSPEYFQMLLRIQENFGVIAIFRDQLGREPHRLQLIIQIFAMFEWEVQKHSLYRGQLAVKSS